MNPLRIRATNYRTFRELDVALPDGCVAVLGENGAGKSSIVNVIDYALFGAESRSLAELLTDDGVADGMEIELMFEHAGEIYRVRRGYSARGRGKTTVDFERCNTVRVDGGVATYDESIPVTEPWTPLTSESARETDAVICRTIGLTRATFRASAFLAQGDGAAFTDCPPAKRKEVLAEVLGLDLWRELQELAKTERRTADAELQRIAGETAQAREVVDGKAAIEADLGLHRRRVTDLETAIAAREAEIFDLEQRYRAAAETAGKRQALEAELAAARAALAQLQQQNAAADTAAREIVAAVAELEQLPAAGDTAALETREADLAAAVDEHTRLVRERDAVALEVRTANIRRDELISQARAHRAEAEKLRERALAILEQHDDAQHCDRCGQLLGEAARQAAAASAQADARDHLEKADALDVEVRAIAIPQIPAEPAAPPTGELEQVRGQLRTVRDSAARRAQLEERIRQHETTAAAGPLPDALTGAHQLVVDKQAELDELEPVDVDTIKDAGARARATLNRARSEHQQAVATVARLEERMVAIAAAEQKLAAAAARVAELHAEVDLCAALEKAYGRDGIPALVIENSAIPSIETEAARILAALGGSTASCRVELRTQAERKTTDGLRDTLDVIIVGENGERAYETFSGGERTRINLALRIALARLLAHRRGAESRLLAIDEPEFLDELGTAALVDVLRGLQTDFDRVYLISHVPALRDSFDDVITVVKDGDRSRVEQVGGEGGVPAAVAA